MAMFQSRSVTGSGEEGGVLKYNTNLKKETTIFPTQLLPLRNMDSEFPEFLFLKKTKNKKNWEIWYLNAISLHVKCWLSTCSL